MIKTLTITKARQELPSLVDDAKKKLTEYIITVNGIPGAILMSYDEYESMMETNAILADQELMKAIRQGEEDVRKGNVISFEQLKKDLNVNV